MKTDKETLKQIAQLVSDEHMKELKNRDGSLSWPFLVGEIQSVLEDGGHLKEKKPCENCLEWELLKHGQEPWIIYCPTCGRFLGRGQDGPQDTKEE